MDPNFEFKIPRELSGYLEAAIHRIRIDVAFTRKYLHKIKEGKSPLSEDCATTEGVEYLC